VTNPRLLSATTFGVLCGVLTLGATIPGDARVARLAKAVHAKGWIVYSAQTERGDWDLFLMRPDGSEQRNISATSAFSELGGRFSPDGKKLLYRRIPKDSRINHDVWGAMGELIVANADGTGANVYGKAGEFPWASWSPDAKQLACLTKTGIEICDFATKKVLRKLERKGIYEQLFWSPDGQWLTGTANHYGESWTVVRMNATTGEVNPVARFQNCTPDWFPDSKRLIYSSRPANQEEPGGANLALSVGQSPGYGWTQLWMVDGDGHRNNLVYGEDSRHIYGGALSPDGRYVIFTRSPVDGGLGIGDKGAPMALIRLEDAPTIGGESKALRKLFPHTKAGPVLRLPVGWEPHWTYAEVPGKK
jgi:Tol biopolymer transport system component